MAWKALQDGQPPAIHAPSRLARIALAYYASVILHGGASIKELAQYLGHFDPALRVIIAGALRRSAPSGFTTPDLLLQRLSRHDHPLDLVGPLVDLGGRGPDGSFRR
jgi:hypothetical protein